MGGKNMYHLLDIALRLPFNFLDWQQHTDQGFLSRSLSFLFMLLYLRVAGHALTVHHPCTGGHQNGAVLVQGCTDRFLLVSLNF